MNNSIKYLLLIGLYAPLSTQATETTGETKRSAEAKIAATYDLKATANMFSNGGNHKPAELEEILASGKADIHAKAPTGYSLLSVIINSAKRVQGDRNNTISKTIIVAL